MTTATKALTKQLTVRFSAEELAAWQVEAEIAGISIPAWLRKTANEAVSQPPKVYIRFATTVRWPNGRVYFEGEPIPQDLATDRFRLAEFFSKGRVFIDTADDE